MCVIDRFTLVYSSEIQKAKDKVIPCRYSADGQPCSGAYIRDRGEHYVLSRSQSEGGYSRPSTYQIIEPGKYTKPDKEPKAAESRHRPKRRAINLDMWGIRIPWAKWSIKRESERQEARVTRGREKVDREANPFIVDPPERQIHRPRSRSRRQYSSPIQEIRPKSPKFKERAPTPPPPPPDPPQLSPSTPSPQRQYPRPPRERTPVSDRVPLRTRKPSSPPEPPIVIHHRQKDESPPLTPTREHRRQRCPGVSPQTDPIRHVNRSQDIRRQAEKDALKQHENGTDYGYRARMEEDSRRAAFADRDRRYAEHCREVQPQRSFAERQYDNMEHSGRDRYGPPLVIQEGRGSHRIHRESERISASEVRNPARNRYGFPSSIFDRLRPRQGFRDHNLEGPLPRRSSIPYGQKMVLDDDSQRSGWRWR